jgi:hypothetical protein
MYTFSSLNLQNARSFITRQGAVDYRSFLIAHKVQLRFNEWIGSV